MPTLPKILGTKLCAKSRLFHIETVQLEFSNGERRDFERIQGWKPGSVLIVPFLDADTVLLIREYKVGIEQYALGFPKGAVGIGEDAIVTANRELQEEVGYGAKELTQVTKFCASPAYLSSSMQVVIARDLYESRLEGDEPEPLEVIPFALDQMDELLANPEFIEATSLAALFWVERMWRDKRVR